MIRNRTFFFTFVVIAALAVLAACSSNAPAPSNNTATQAKSATAAKAPAERNDMYSAAPPMTIDVNKKYRATIVTNKGNIVVDLFPQDAPQHVNNFVFLARDGFYDGLKFHRVEPGFVIQGGDPLGNGTGGPGYTIPPEIKRTHPKGALAMARRGGPPETTPSSGSQFYITLDATPFLDGGYTSFGQTTADSMNVVNQIQVGDVIQTITIEEQ
jgi:cyclophilin family peptidyl-prolyl cis-trans isomerase